ncbi:MAG: Ig-like domain repeat protein [Terriglobales bacterium]
MLTGQCCAGGLFEVAKGIQGIGGSAALRRKRSILPLLALALITATELLSIGARATAQQGPILPPRLASGPGALPPLGPITPANRTRAAGHKNLTKALAAELLPPPSPIFLTAPTYGSGGYASYSVAVADVNGDGKPDMVVANWCASNGNCTNGSIGVLLGNGDGTFQTAVGYDSGGIYVRSVAVADVNGDGKPDVVVANQCANSNCTNGSIGVLLGNGDGTFQTAVSYGSDGIYADSVAVADVNGDGKPDLLVANECTSSNCTNGSVSVLLGNGDGTFQTAVSYGSGGEYAWSVAVADVNGDGKPDLLVSNECASNCTNGSVSVLLGNGDGTFQTAVGYGSGGEDALSVAVADVNGDGKPDVVVLNQCASNSNCTNGSVSVLLGNGDGTFQTAVSYGSGGEDALSVAVADVNGDGKPDLVVANQCFSSSNCTNGSVSVLLGNGDGTFQTALITSTPELPGIESLAVADFNGDGKLDVASGAGNVLLLGNGDGTFQTPYTLGAGGPGIAVGDFNLDGRPDLAVGGVTILLNISTGFVSATTTAVSASPNPASFGQSVTITATVASAFNAGPLTGTVTFYDGTTSLGSAAVGNGQATLSTTTLLMGANAITASYSGNTDYKPSTSAVLTETVNTATTTTTLNSSLNPSSYNQSVTFTSGVSSLGGTPTGTVTFVDGTTALGTSTLSGSGIATFSISTLSVGTHSITAVYNGSADFSGSTSPVLSQVVQKASTTTAVSSSLNPSTDSQSVTFTATLSWSAGGTPTGSVAFLDGTNTLGTSPVNGSGVATFSISTLSVGTHNITAAYSGDGNFSGSTSPALSQVVQQGNTSTALTSSLNPSTESQSVTFTATVSSAVGLTPTGTVKFVDGTTILGTLVLNGAGVATFTTSTLSVGTQSITAVYSGDANNDPSTSPVLNQVVQKANTTTGLIANPASPNLNQTVTFTATVTPGIAGTPTGAVSFLDGTTQLGTSPVNGSGIATFSISTLAAGSHSITATYSGDGNFNGSTSGVVTLVVTAPNFSLTSSTLSPSSIAPGASAKSTITINPVGGMNPSSPTLSCSVSPVVNPAATCSLGAITVENGTGTATLTVATIGPQAALAPPTERHRTGPLFALALMIPAMLFGGAGLNQSGRKKLMSFCLVFLVIGGCLLQAACGASGGNGGNSGTPAGSYTVTITGNANGTQHTTSVSLTVQ